MNLYALDRLSDICKHHNLAGALLSNPATITWLTGYAAPIQTGPSPFEGAPALGWFSDGSLRLAVSDMESGAAQAQGADTIDYVAYTIEAPIDGFGNQAQALKRLLSGAKGLKGEVGVELNYLPAVLLDQIHELLPGAKLSKLDGQFELLRAVKAPDEVSRIRKALKLCDLAQAETKRLIQPGMSEIEVWGLLKQRLEVEAGGRLAMLADFVAGERTGEIGGLPGETIMKPGDAVIADIVPRLDGYWGDNAGTHFVGEPASELRRYYQVVLDALRKGIEAVKPGVRCCDLDEMLRNQIRAKGFEAYPHHSGHGLGTTFHEEPRIVPYNTLKLEAGMVVAIEPGIYTTGIGGVRLEDVVLVTADGCEVLTKHLGN